jgi:hypothetical protein
MSNNKPSSLDKEFVLYQEALALKELGFDEPCLSIYDKDGKLQRSLLEYPIINSKNGFHEHWNIITAPLYQQAFRWFRHEYALESYIRANLFVDVPKTYQFNIDDNIDDVWYDTYEEAELACLKKLIEIVKGGNK